MSLSEGHQIIGNKVVAVDQTDSTNVLLAAMERESEYPEGTVVFAGEQTAGRGQFSKVWESAAGENILCSILLKPKFLKTQQVFNLNIAISLGVFNMLHAEFPGRVQIKWSNDILVDGKKIAGILIENQIAGEQVSRSIAGIGLNINQSAFGPFLPHATSLRILTGQSQNIEQWKARLMQSIDHYYKRLLNGFSEQDKKIYIKHLFGHKVWKWWSGPEGVFEGMITGIDTAGRLLMLTRDGHSTLWNPGELKPVDFL